MFEVSFNAWGGDSGGPNYVYLPGDAVPTITAVLSHGADPQPNYLSRVQVGAGAPPLLACVCVCLPLACRHRSTQVPCVSRSWVWLVLMGITGVCVGCVLMWLGHVAGLRRCWTVQRQSGSCAGAAGDASSGHPVHADGHEPVAANRQRTSGTQGFALAALCHVAVGSVALIKRFCYTRLESAGMVLEW